MPGRDDFRSNREHEEYERRRREMDRAPRRGAGEGERRSFDERGRFGSDQARYDDRAGSRYDQDRARYGSNPEDRWRREGRSMREEREPWRDRRPDEFGYGGQEYGIEARGGDFARGPSVVQRTTDGGDGRRLQERFGQDDRGDPPFRGPARGGGSVSWRDDGAPYGDAHLERQDRGMQEFGVPHDYGFHPHDPEFEPHYAHWRDEQMRRHDDEYRRWRDQQLRQYDDDYRTWRGERRQAFGETFSQWRSGRSNLSTGTPDTGVAPGVTGQASFGAKQTGYGGGGLPSGAQEGAASPASASSNVGDQRDPKAAEASSRDTGFSQASPAVQKATDGAARDKDRSNEKDDPDRDGRGAG